MQEVGDLFYSVQESHTISNKTVFALIENYESNQRKFLLSLEQCYLRILKFLSGLRMNPKKILDRYEKLTEKFFQTIKEKYQEEKKKGSKSLDISDVHGAAIYSIRKSENLLLFYIFLRPLSAFSQLFR